MRRRWSGLPERIRREAKLAPLLKEASPPSPEAEEIQDTEADEAQFTEEAPPDSLYENEATEGDEDSPPENELTYHPVDE